MTSSPKPASRIAQKILAGEEVAKFWDDRHAVESELRSGGDISLAEQDNLIFYYVRLGKLLQLLASASPLLPRFSILDAGCGKGWFSRALAAVGLHVLGIDNSPAAIQYARQSGGGPKYEVSPLATYKPLHHMDAVICVDVLFHIVDDDEWEASVRNIANIVRPGGTLVYADTTQTVRRMSGSYIAYRPKADYKSLLKEYDFTFRRVCPYEFRRTHLGLFAYDRKW